MITRRAFGSALAGFAACAAASAIVGCDDGTTESTPEVQQEQQESRNKSMEYMQGKGGKKKKS